MSSSSPRRRTATALESLNLRWCALVTDAGPPGISDPGGLLALWNVHFRLADMTIASRFAPVLELARGVTANQPLYGQDDRHLNNVFCTTAVYLRI